MKTSQINLRVTANQHKQFAQAAERDGLSISGWLRMLALRAVRTEGAS